jgi:anti-sigma B factor antagonist
MLNIGIEANGDSLTLRLEGKLNTTAAMELDEKLRQALPGVKELVLDLEKLEYITSAGLRVLLFAQKTMATQGKMTLRNVGSEILKILKMTGMLKMMTIE